MEKKYGIFINRKAGKGKPLVFSRLIQEELKKHNLQFDIHDVNWPTNLEGLTDVFVVGGDGTLNYFINRYPNCELPITIIRSGSGNDFHKALFGKKKDFKKIFEAALHGGLLPVDAGNCNGKWFLNGCGIGFDGSVVNSMNKTWIRLSGLAAYIAHVFKNIFLYRSTKYTLYYNRKEISLKAFMITVANGEKYGGGFHVAPGADFSDGKLDLVIIKAIHPFLRLFHLPKIQTGKHTSLKQVTHEKIESIKIQTELPVHAHVDGEYFITNQFNISIHKHKFKFRVPEKNAEE